MKKAVCFLILLLATIATQLAAQDCKICGDWIGIYKEQVPERGSDGEIDVVDKFVKIYIRINQYGEDLSIRVKTHPEKEPNELRYWSDCVITNKTDNSISFKSIIDDDYDWDSNDRINGHVIYKAVYSGVCFLDFHNGKMELSSRLHVDYYDKANYWIGGEDFKFFPKTTLFQDNDW